MRDAALSVGLSLVLAFAFVSAKRLGPQSAALSGPFANLHGGFPRGLPEYRGKLVSGPAISDGWFEHDVTTDDPPATVLAFYRRSIDPAIWTITSTGSRWLLFHYVADPAVRGGIDASVIEPRTYVTVWLVDLRVPAGFATDFPAGHRAVTLEASTRDGDTFVLRWDIRGNGTIARFVAEFAQMLDQAGWEVLAKDASLTKGRAITCRSRAQPELFCSVTLSVETFPAPGFTYGYQVEVATVRVGSRP